MGAACIRHSLRPLIFRRDTLTHHPGAFVPREGGGVSRNDDKMQFDIHIGTTRTVYGLVKLSITAAAFFIASAFAVTFAGTSCRFSPGSSKSCVAPI